MALNNILFDILSNILKDKSNEIYLNHINADDFDKTFPKYMLIRYLSMHSSSDVNSIVLNNQLQFERMPNRALYKFLLDNVPKQKSSWIKYIK